MLSSANAQRLNQCDRIFVGYSGGMDSHVLLHCLLEQGYGSKLTALHFNHAYSDQSQDFADHVAAQCTALGVGFISAENTVEIGVGGSVEAQLRTARYAFFEAQMSTNSILTLAHHADDQAETVLLRLLRGAGVDGLAAIPESRRLGEGILLRPLLHVSRASLAQYAAKHQLSWIEDVSNSDAAFDRNFIRQNVMPVLAQRWPQLHKRFYRSASLCAETSQWMAEQAERLKSALLSPTGELQVSGLLALGVFEQKLVLRAWLKNPPSEQRLSDLLNSVCLAEPDAEPEWHGNGLIVRRYRDYLYQCTESQPVLQTRYAIVDSLHVPSIGHIQLLPAVNEGADIRFRCGGEKIKPQGRAHTVSVKNVMQEAGIPPWQRNRIPMLYIDDELMAIAGICRAEGSPCTLEWKPE